MATRFPKLCVPAQQVREALAKAGYRCGWQLETDPKSEYRPHYRLSGYVGRGGVIIVQDFYDPGDVQTSNVEVYTPMRPTSREVDAGWWGPTIADMVEEIMAYERGRRRSSVPR